MSTREDTVQNISAIIGEGLHSMLRKGADSPAAKQAWRAIGDMPDDEWAAVCHATAEAVVQWYELDNSAAPDQT